MGSPAYDVAIHAPAATPMYLGAPSVGGAERQMMMLARALAARGLRVCHVVGEAQGLPASADGVDLVAERASTPGDPPWTRLARVAAALRRADANVYVQRSSGLSTLLVGAYARGHRRAFVHSVSSPQGLAGDLGLSRVERFGAAAGLRCAHAVVVQTGEQAAWLGRSRRVVHIPSLCEPASVAAQPRDSFLWVGRPASYKAPRAFVELARDVPEARFVMVGIDPLDPGAFDDVVADAQSLSNLELVPALPRPELAPFYDRAIAVVNTSDFEGFPNTFLEGWSHGALALSLRIDPDRVIAREGLGAVAGGLRGELAAAARRMWRERDDLDRERERAVRYVADRHAPDAVAARWHDLVSTFLPARRGG